MGAIIDGLTLKYRISRLKSAKADLTDDASSIRSINSYIDSVKSDLSSFIGSSASSVIRGRLDSYKEPSQSSDSNLTNAAYYVQKEIDVLNNQLSILNANDGGGGSW